MFCTFTVKQAPCATAFARSRSLILVAAAGTGMLRAQGAMTRRALEGAVAGAKRVRVRVRDGAGRARRKLETVLTGDRTVPASAGLAEVG